MSDDIRHGTAEWRVLVEFAGQDRAMTVRELYDELGGVYTPERLHEAVRELRWGPTAYVETVYQGLGLERAYCATWEGRELLRRLEPQDAVSQARAASAPAWARRFDLMWLVVWLDAVVVGLYIATALEHGGWFWWILAAAWMLILGLNARTAVRRGRARRMLKGRK